MDNKTEEGHPLETRSDDAGPDNDGKMSDIPTTPPPSPQVVETESMEENLSNTQHEDPLTTVEEVNTPPIQDASPVPPPTLRTSNPDSAVTKYKNGMESWSTLQNQEQLLKLHYQSIAEATKGLTADEKVAVKIKLNGYFMYILELFETQREPALHSSPICIYFADADIKMGLFTSQSMVGPGGELIDLGFSSSRLGSSYPSNILASRDELLGYILKVANHNEDIFENKKLSKEKRLIVELLEWVKNYSERGTGNTFEQCIIVIPTWFQVQHRIVLREALHLAQFSKCYLVTEASLAAFSVLEKPLNDIPTVVTFTVGMLGVGVEMYTIINKTVKMVALEKFEWELNEADADTKGCNVVCLPFVKRNKIRRAMETQDDPFRILMSTYTKAADQLVDNSKEQGKETYYLSESASWKNSFTKFMGQCPDPLNWQASPEDWILYAVMRLSKSVRTGKLREVLIDHVLSNDEDNVEPGQSADTVEL